MKREIAIDTEVEKEAEVALHAVQKEFDFEKLAVQEEELREKELEAKLNKELEFALEKENILKNDIGKEERALHDQENEKQVQIKANLIKLQAIENIKKVRQLAQERVEQLKRESDNRRKTAK